MKTIATNPSAAKRPFNLTLSEQTVEQARRYTNNLSATVDGLLAEFVSNEEKAREEKRQLYAKVSEAGTSWMRSAAPSAPKILRYEPI